MSLSVQLNCTLLQHFAYYSVSGGCFLELYLNFLALPVQATESLNHLIRSLYRWTVFPYAY